VFLELREFDGLRAAAARLITGEAQLREIGVHVLTAGEIGMKARTDLQERVEVAADLELPRRGLDHAGNQLEECTLPGAVAADDRDLLAAADLETHVVERRVFSEGALLVPEQPEHVEKPVGRLRVQAIDLLQVDRADQYLGAVAHRLRPGTHILSDGTRN